MRSFHVVYRNEESKLYSIGRFQETFRGGLPNSGWKVAALLSKAKYSFEHSSIDNRNHHLDSGLQIAILTNPTCWEAEKVDAYSENVNELIAWEAELDRMLVLEGFSRVNRKCRIRGCTEGVESEFKQEWSRKLPALYTGLLKMIGRFEKVSGRIVPSAAKKALRAIYSDNPKLEAGLTDVPHNRGEVIRFLIEQTA